MKLDGKNFAINDPESQGQWALRLAKRKNEMSRLGIVSPLDICFRRLGRSMRM